MLLLNEVDDRVSSGRRWRRAGRGRVGISGTGAWLTWLPALGIFAGVVMCVQAVVGFGWIDAPMLLQLLRAVCTFSKCGVPGTPQNRLGNRLRSRMP